MEFRYRIRTATRADAAIIARHRVRMFRELGEPPETEAAVERAARDRLQDLLSSGEYRGWLAETGGIVVAGVGALLHPRLPRHSNLAGAPEAYLLNVFTEPAHRRRGLARALIDAVVAWCCQQGVTRVALHASDAGRPLYEALGFSPTGELRREIDP
jgi:GNAT superfamily N-acetyltransferase